MEDQLMPVTENISTEEKIYEVATNKDYSNWKQFLYQLINSEGIDPWNIDLTLLTKKYLQAIRNLTTVDFDITGKFLTIAVYLLKTKAEFLVEKDLRGIQDKIDEVRNSDSLEEDIESLEDFDSEIDQFVVSEDEVVDPKEKYVLRYRNPLARKRKVTIFDLIKALEKTFEQSNKRKANFLLRKGDEGKYSGPIYEKKTKDLKTIIEELHNSIMERLNQVKQLNFREMINGCQTKMDVLKKFIPLLHLHNQNKLDVNQREHFGDILICEADED
jgi:segregation and condensation protein A